MRNLLFFSTLSIALTGLNVSAKAADRFEAGRARTGMVGSDARQDAERVAGVARDQRTALAPT